MKVALDISPLESGHKVRGVGFYVQHLKDALEKYFPENTYVFFKDNPPSGRVDLIHYPYFDPFTLTLPMKKKAPTVVTIHDLTPIVFKEQFPVGIKGRVYWELNRQRLRFIDGVVTDSECSTRDVLKHIPISQAKVKTVYLAAGEEFGEHDLSDRRRNELREKYHLPERFALYVGDVTWNKNLPRLLRAAEKAGVPLVLVGKAITEKNFDASHPWNKDRIEIQRCIDTYENIQALGFVSSEDLVALYNVATVFVMPSLYEGFGLPIIEAMQSGTPVITSREGSLAEVGGEAVYYVDADSEESIAMGLRKVLDSGDLQKMLKEKGLVQAAKFSWKQTATDTLSFYKNLIHEE